MDTAPMNTVTIGGILVGIAILILVGIRWWTKEGHQIAAAASFLLSAAYGMLLIISTGGLLSGLAGITVWGANGLGDLSLVWGAGGTTGDVTRAHQTALAQGGYVVVVLLTVVMVGLWIWSNIPKGKLAAGTVAGICFGLSGTIAGAAAVPLASGANGLGAAITAAFQ